MKSFVKSIQFVRSAGFAAAIVSASFLGACATSPSNVANDRQIAMDYSNVMSQAVYDQLQGWKKP